MKRSLLALLLCISAPLLSQAQTYTYTPKTNLPSVRYAFNSVTLNNKVYIFGGSDMIAVQNIAQVYDVATNAWFTLQPLPYAVTEAFAGEVNGKIYVVGGWNGSQGVNFVQEYDPIANAWTQKATMPTSRGLVSGAVIGNKIFITCGYPGQFNTLEVYDPATNSWSTNASAPYGMAQDLGGAALGSNMYVAGGANDSRTTLYDYTLQYNTTTNTWSTKAPLPEQRFAGCAVAYQGKIHYFGGFKTHNAQDVTNTHYIYDEATNAWSTGLPLPKRLSHVSATVIGNKIYIGGGMDSSGTLVNDYWEYGLVGDGGGDPPPTTGVANNPIKQAEMTVYPNPASNTIHVKLTKMATNARMSICNAVGAVLETKSVDKDVTIFNINALPAGMYIVRYNDNMQAGFITVSKM
jgi:Uncharacterized protein conserved in bacteria